MRYWLSDACWARTQRGGYGQVNQDRCSVGWRILHKEVFDMTNREFYVERRRAEVPVFLKVLKALPADRLSYKPHDRCPSAEQLVWTLASELRAGVDV